MEHWKRMAHIGKSLLMFDLDGTVADTCADLAGAVNHVRAEQGLAALPDRKGVG
jgi:phosphoglycolate phosphatase-like HAD superfamily hydrolase